jgi:hypothetical protein
LLSKNNSLNGGGHFSNHTLYISKHCIKANLAMLCSNPTNMPNLTKLKILETRFGVFYQLSETTPARGVFSQSRNYCKGISLQYYPLQPQVTTKRNSPPCRHCFHQSRIIDACQILCIWTP